jgi:gamma-glutamyltranspeptidase/glutathione hydrolase
MIRRFLLVSLTLFVALCSRGAQAASLPPVPGNSSMVVSAQHYATEAGQLILDKGGNAIDAAVAMGYALAVVHPCCGNIGGGGFMLIRFANGKTTFLNFREEAPEAISVKMFSTTESSTWLSGGHLKGRSEKPYLSIGVPGTVKGLNTALKEYGTLSLTKIMRPAIELAEKGYILEPQDVAILSSASPDLEHESAVRKTFLHGVKSFHVGQRFVQKDLAYTLKKIARSGTNEFYQGSLAQKIVKFIRSKGGLLSKKDLRDYTVEEMSPIICHYRGYDLILSPPPSSGGVTVCEILNILEGYPLGKLGYHSAASVHYLVEALRYSYADRNSYLGDPDFVHNPIETLTSKKYAQDIRQKIQDNKANDSHDIGFVTAHPEGPNTTAYVVVDGHGNSVSVTYTLNDFFGSKQIAGDTGFFLNNELADFTLKVGEPNSYGLIQSDKNIIAPKKRPLSSIAPTMITKNGKLVMVLGTPGGSTIPSQLVGVIQNVIDYGMDIQLAVDSPRIHMQWLPDKVYLEPFALSEDTEVLLKKMGYELTQGSPYGTPRWGAVMAIRVDPNSGKLTGAVDSRRPAGLAIGQ